MAREIEIPRGSAEYVKAVVTADVNLSMTVEMALTKTGAAHTWLPAEWTGSVGLTRTARTTAAQTFSTANYPASSYQVYVRLTDTPELPIVKAGTVKVT